MNFLTWPDKSFVKELRKCIRELKGSYDILDMFRLMDEHKTKGTRLLQQYNRFCCKQPYRRELEEYTELLYDLQMQYQNIIFYSDVKQEYDAAQLWEAFYQVWLLGEQEQSLERLMSAFEDAQKHLVQYLAKGNHLDAELKDMYTKARSRMAGFFSMPQDCKPQPNLRESTEHLSQNV